MSQVLTDLWSEAAGTTDLMFALCVFAAELLQKSSSLVP